MIGRPGVPPQIAPKEPQAAIVSPRSVADRMAHEMVEAIDPIAVVPWPRERVANLLCQLGRNPLIGVENKNPLVGRLRNGPILEVATRAVLALDDAASHAARDLECAV